MISGKTYLAPVAVREASMFMDGGTLTLLIVDSQGKELQVCNDGSVVQFRDSYGRPQNKVEPPPIYVGGYHPLDGKARPLELGGADEQALHRMLKDWFEEAQRQGGPRLPGDGSGDKARYATNFLRHLEKHVDYHKPK